AVLIPREASQEFSGADFAHVYSSKDSYGYPAVGFELTAERREAFADFTEHNIGRRLAIVLRGEVRSCPTLNARLVRGGIIEGRFTDEEAGELITVLREGGARFTPSPYTILLAVKLLVSAVIIAVTGVVLWRARRKRGACTDDGEADADALPD